MRYDYTLEYDGIEYGFINGDDRVVFVKVGLGGTCRGYEEKYLKMASMLRAKYGCGVIVASNPNDSKSHVDSDRFAIESYASDKGFTELRLFLFGHSNGCIKGLELATVLNNFSKMVLVNMPLMINYHKTKKYLSALNRTEILLACGELDPSFSYLAFIDGRFDNVKILRLKQTDHNFSGKTDEFISLSEYLMESDTTC